MSALARLRIATWFEGVSLLVLVLIAMPLKYLAGYPVAVRVVGSVHGVLFLVFGMALFRVALERDWPAGRTFRAVLASVIPFGAFVLDAALRRDRERDDAAG